MKEAPALPTNIKRGWKGSRKTTTCDVSLFDQTNQYKLQDTYLTPAKSYVCDTSVKTFSYCMRALGGRLANRQVGRLAKAVS